MKGILVLSGSGPLLLLSSYPAIDDPALIAKLRAKGLDKFLAWEVPVDHLPRPLRLHLPRHRRAAARRATTCACSTSTGTASSSTSRCATSVTHILFEDEHVLAERVTDARA